MMNRFGLLEKLPKSIKILTQAGGRLEPELQEKIAQLAIQRKILFYIMYGQTEATARISYLPPSLALEKAGCVGKAIPGGINGRRIRLEHLEENWKKYFRSNMVCSFDDSKLYLLVEGKISEENVKKLREWIPILEKDIIAREVDKLPRKANGKVNVAFRA